ncbi:MAG TPA: tetratricopeptide repeat protein [Nitrosopumilaceae archaeon]|nr:tetratricopeptide repeat protein [Nitrosopumilaceae archaeon]
MFSWLRKKNNLSSPEYKFRHSRKEASEEYVKYGEDLANGNRPEEALEYFDKAIQILPNNDFAWGDKGLILDKLGRTDEALESFSHAIAIDSTNSITWHNKGLTLIKLKRLEEAIECFDSAIENNEKYAKAWYNKGRALAMLNKADEGQKCFDTARKLDPFLYSKLKKMK